MKIFTQVCKECKKRFYIEEREEAPMCAFCGSEEIYCTYSYFAEPTLEEM